MDYQINNNPQPLQTNNVNQVQPQASQKKRTMPILIVVGVIILLVLLIGLGVFAYQYWASYSQKEAKDAQQALEQYNNQTADWQIYSNDQFRFEVKIPSSIEVVEDHGQAVDTFQFNQKSDGGGIFVIQVSGSRETDLQKIITGYYNKDTIENIDYISFNGYQGADIHFITGEGNMILLNEGYIYVMPLFTNDNPTIRNILSTFKFTTPTDQTIDWKMYTNDQYGFQLQYPSNALTPKIAPNVEPDKYIAFLGIVRQENRPKVGNVYGNLFEVSIIKTVDSEYQKVLALAGNQEKDVVISGIKGKRVDVVDKSEPGVNRTYIHEYINKDGLTYDFNFVLVPGENIDDFNVFNQILSTFKFTNPTDQTADWKMYNSIPFKFSIKYPPELTANIHQMAESISFDEASGNWGVSTAPKLESNVTSYPKYFTYQESVAAHYEKLKTFKNFRQKNITVAGKNSTEFNYTIDFQHSDYIDILVPLPEGNSYFLINYYAKGGAQQDSKEEFYKMVSTFKFNK